MHKRCLPTPAQPSCTISKCPPAARPRIALTLATFTLIVLANTTVVLYAPRSLLRTTLFLPLLRAVEHFDIHNTTWTFALLLNALLWTLALLRLLQSTGSSPIKMLCRAVWLATALFLATLWVESYRHEVAFVRTVARPNGGRDYVAHVICHTGRIYLSTGISTFDENWNDFWSTDVTPQRWFWSGYQNSAYDISVIEEAGYGPKALGFAYRHIPNFGTPRERYAIIIPCWFFAAILLIPPIVSRIRTTLRTRRAIRKDLCHHCGYDLRATPTRCPECGTTPSTHLVPT
jgi:hypothetical protein